MRKERLIGYTPKQRQYMELRVKTNLKPTEIVRRVYDTKHPNKLAHKIENKPHIKEGMQVMLQRKGITPEFLGDRLVDLFFAEDEHGNRDYVALDKALEKAFKIYGSYSPERRENVNVSVDGNTYLEDLKQKAQEEPESSD